MQQYGAITRALWPSVSEGDSSLSLEYRSLAAVVPNTCTCTPCKPRTASDRQARDVSPPSCILQIKDIQNFHRGTGAEACDFHSCVAVNYCPVKDTALWVMKFCLNKKDAVVISSLKENKGQNQYSTRVFIRKIQVTFRKCVLYPDKVLFEISPLKVEIRSLCWDHCGRNPNKRS